MPSLLVSVNRSFSRAAPSSIEYSVWTCRCTNESPGPTRATLSQSTLTSAEGILSFFRVEQPAVRLGHLVFVCFIDQRPHIAQHLRGGQVELLVAAARPGVGVRED